MFQFRDSYKQVRSYLKNSSQNCFNIEKIKEAGKVVANCHIELSKIIKAGISTIEINNFAETFILKNGGYPALKGYKNYKYATCISVNNEVCHSLPSENIIANGDIVSIDFVVNFNGWLADSTWTYPVGNISADKHRLLCVAKEALYIGINKAIVGNRVGDISNSIEKFAKYNGFSIVEEFHGHGIGKTLHEGISIPHYGDSNKGVYLQKGMVFTIEPILTSGKKDVYVDADGWTVKTHDGSLSAQYEHTIAVTSDAPLILTARNTV